MGKYLDGLKGNILASSVTIKSLTNITENQQDVIILYDCIYAYTEGYFSDKRLNGAQITYLCVCVINRLIENTDNLDYVDRLREILKLLR